MHTKQGNCAVKGYFRAIILPRITGFNLTTSSTHPIDPTEEESSLPITARCLKTNQPPQLGHGFHLFEGVQDTPSTSYNQDWIIHASQ